MFEIELESELMNRLFMSVLMAVKIDEVVIDISDKFERFKMNIWIHEDSCVIVQYLVSSLKRQKEVQNGSSP